MHNNILSKYSRNLCRFSCFFILLLFSLSAYSQSKREIQKRQEQLRKDIEYTNKLLNDTKVKKSVSLNMLVTLNKKISIREELINTINDELVDMNHQIAQINIQIDNLQKELNHLKKEYAKMVNYAYKNQGAYKKLMFVFAARDFNQAYKRLKYLQQYSNFRKKQARLITGKKQELSQKIAELQLKKQAKKSILTKEEVEKQTLSGEKSEQESLVNTLQEREKLLKKDLAKKQKAEATLNRALDELVRKEIEAARKKAEAAGNKNVTKSNVFNLAPEAIKLTSDFESNKGKLPWPVEQGVVTSTFGAHPHPALKGIMINNNGITINSQKGSNALSIFEGQVTGVVSIPGSNTSVIVRHGDYLSVYSNLSDVYVKKGDKISTKQSIGRIYTDEEDSQTELNLQIWKGEVRLDPSEWLYRKIK